MARSYTATGPRPSAMRCGECGQIVQPADRFHPFLYCELFKLGHRDQAAYLRSYGFARGELNG